MTSGGRDFFLRDLNPTHGQDRFSSGQRTALWVLWITYGTFYFARNNLGVALPGIQAEFGFTKSQLGTVLMALKLAYGAGQFLNGQLAEHASPRKLLAIGLLASAALNVLFGWATSLYFLTFVWACNGYVQALGGPPTMRVAANWFPALQRGRAIGIIGTGYQLCGALTFVVAGSAADYLGWRGALYVPAVLVTISAVHMLVSLEDAPHSARPSELHAARTTAPARRNSLWQILAATLSNPGLWLIAIALCLLDACRYGFTDWGDTPKCYVEVHGRRRLDHAIAAFAQAGITDVCFIGGYQIGKVRRDYPHFTFRHNAGWEHNNILLSLMYAEDQMAGGFVP